MSNQALPSDPVRPKELYPSYYYLWHLCEIGVLDADFVQDSPCPMIVNTVWDDLLEVHKDDPRFETTIAMIDVGVGINHPNLGQVDAARSIDLVTHPHGAQFKANGEDHDKRPPKFFGTIETGELKLCDLSMHERELLTSLVGELGESTGIYHTDETLDAALPSHGTAMAGLAVGDPGLLGIEKYDGGGRLRMPLNELVRSDRAWWPRENVIPYFGADPFSRLVSIKTSFDDDPRGLMTALLYAYWIGADVILLPRDIPDPVHGIPRVKAEIEQDRHRREDKQIYENEGSGAGAMHGPTNADEWSLLNKLIVAVSKLIPIVCAAGNSGESQLIYPASLAEDEQNGIIAVGAVNHLRCRAGYSNYGKGLTVVAPSDDGEVYNKHQLRIDSSDPATRMHRYDRESRRSVEYSYWAITTTDLPGAWGYAEGTVPFVANLAPEDNPGFGGGHYTSFGGTSAAAGLVAGVLALMARAYKTSHGSKEKLTGVDAKKMLKSSSRLSWENAAGENARLTPDPMNCDDEASREAQYFFGFGLINAREAVKEVDSKFCEFLSKRDGGGRQTT